MARITRSIVAFLIVGAVVPTGCTRRLVRVVRDTEGRSWELRCTVRGLDALGGGEPWRTCRDLRWYGQAVPLAPLPATPSNVADAQTWRWTITQTATGLGAGTPGRVHAVCDVWDRVNWTHLSPVGHASCRPIVCSSDSDCAPFASGTCARGLCANPSRPLSTRDVLALCQAGTGTTGDTPSEPVRVERIRAALAACPPGAAACAVPPECRAP